MEAKKSPKADLENKKGLFLEVGLVIIMAVCLVAFNWKNYDQEELEVNQRTALNEIDEDVLNTEDDQPEPEPEPEIEVEVPETTEFVEVEDNKEIENEFTFNAEDDAKKAQDAYVAPTAVQEEVEEEEEILVFVEKDPEFPGGAEALLKYLAENIQYPDMARQGNIEGKVYVQFVVEKDGSVTNVKVLRDIGAGCGQEAVRVIKSMPKWTPGENAGKRVRAQFNQQVVFKLR